VEFKKNTYNTNFMDMIWIQNLSTCSA